MLLGIDPLLGPDLLALLRAMGHGDRLVLCDANFPAHSIGKRSMSGAALRLDGVGVLRALEAVLSVLPIDDFVLHPLTSMQVVGDPGAVPPIVAEMQRLVDARVPAAPRIVAVERHAFYALAGDAQGVVATGERAFYANLIVQKGVVAPESEST